METSFKIETPQDVDSIITFALTTCKPIKPTAVSAVAIMIPTFSQGYPCQLRAQVRRSQGTTDELNELFKEETRRFFKGFDDGMSFDELKKIRIFLRAIEAELKTRG